MELADLLLKLPEADERLGAPQTQTPNDFGLITSHLNEFVPPHLSEREDIDHIANPQIIIISAPGAVGKSTLAREIAFDLTGCGKTLVLPPCLE